MMRNQSRIVRFAVTIGALGGLLPLVWAAPLWAQTSGAAEGVSQAATTGGSLGLGMIFMCFFVMLGPVKIPFSFVKLTSGLEEAATRKLALEAIGVACIGGILAAFVGQRILVIWGISTSALHLAAGVILFLVALQSVLAQYAPAQDGGQPEPARHPAISPLAFPIILAPYGISTFILILAVTHESYGLLPICVLFLVIMLMNLGAMWYARAIVQRGGEFLAILLSILSVLQVALAVQLMLDALRILKVLPT